MRFRIPKRFTLNGRRWHVLHPRTIGKGRTAALGLAQKVEGVIQIAKHPDPPDGQFEVFCHELVHAALPIGMLDSEVEEEVADVLARALPDMVRALVEE